MTDKIKISIDKNKLNMELIYNYLSASYWGKNYTFDSVKKSIQNSFCFGVYIDNRQIGFARVITDFVNLAYLADVFIIEEFQGQGIGKYLLDVVFNHPELNNIKKWMLATQDAAGLYKKYGFNFLATPQIYMERKNSGK